MQRAKKNDMQRYNEKPDLQEKKWHCFSMPFFLFQAIKVLIEWLCVLKYSNTYQTRIFVNSNYV